MMSLSSVAITPGQRLAFDVFSEDQRILLLRGALIRSDEDVRQLRSRGFYKRRPESRVTVFAALSKLADRLCHLYDDIRQHQEIGSFSKRVYALGKECIEWCDSDPDASFASLHLNIHHPYIVVHSMMAAVVCSRLALARGFSRDLRLSLVCAALTHDIGLLDMVDFINAKDVLSEAEMRRVRQHVQLGMLLLDRLGVRDEEWLNAVADHHEFLDGGGYVGKCGDALGLGARILTLADSYSAMLRPRPYRDRLMARKALEALYSDELDRYDGSLIENLIWDLGFNPPGSVLRLRNHEMAVVIRNSPGILDGPNVASFTDSQGRPLLSPILRNTNDPEFAAVDVLDPLLATRMGQQIERCWAV